MYHFLKINVIYLRQRIFNYCNILKRVMKNTGLFVFLFSLCLCTTSCVDDEADFTGGGNIDVECLSTRIRTQLLTRKFLM